MTPLGWFGIVRLGLIQTALGSIVVLTTSTLNRVMIVELALPAVLPGALVALYYTVQLLRPRLGYGSDIGGRRTPWIIGGMALLAVAGVGAAAATALMGVHAPAGIALAIVAFLLIGVGVGAAGTSLLVLLAKRVDDRRRSAAAFGLGGLLGTASIDLTRYLFDSPVISYATVFTAEALLFLVAAGLAAQVGASRVEAATTPSAVTGDGHLPSMNQR